MTCLNIQTKNILKCSSITGWQATTAGLLPVSTRPGGLIGHARITGPLIASTREVAKPAILSLTGEELVGHEPPGKVSLYCVNV